MLTTVFTDARAITAAGLLATVGVLSPAALSAQGVPIRLLTCPANQIAVSAGNGGWVCGDPASGQTSGDKIVFVTSETYTGNFQGPVGADAVCQQRAEAAGLPGRYRAWLSSATREPNGHFEPMTGAYRRVDGTLVANGWTDLVTEKQTPTEFFLRAPINMDEFGAYITGETRVWTGTTVEGLAASLVCGVRPWSSQASNISAWVGLASSTSFLWTEATMASCNSRLRLYCFQQ